MNNKTAQSLRSARVQQKVDSLVRQSNLRLLQLNIEDELEELRYLSENFSSESDIPDPLPLIKSHPYYYNFWDAESLNWDNRITQNQKEIISCLVAENFQSPCLNIGAGTNNYHEPKKNEKIYCLDYSAQMLGKNKSKVKVLADLENNLPFRKESFNCVMALFTLNYVKNLKQLIREIKDMLSPKGTFIVLQGPLNKWYKKQSIHSTEMVLNLLKHTFDMEIRYESEIKKLGDMQAFICTKKCHI